MDEEGGKGLRRRTRRLVYEQWHCTECDKKLSVNRYRSDDLSPIKVCTECRKKGKEEKKK